MSVPKRSIDLRAATAAVLAVVSLLGTITVVVIGLVSDADKDAVALAATTLGGFTTTFGAYALGIQSEVRQ